MPRPRPSAEKKRICTSHPMRRPVVAAPRQESGDGRERLQKVLAAAGVASRRECETFILEGRVEVDRNVVTELGTKVDRDAQEIRIDGEPLRKTKIVWYAVHKPPGVVSTTSDPSGRTRVIDLVPQSAERIFNVGRLDAASEGLILATNDGQLANLLTHPRHGVEKTYHVTVAGHVRPVALQRLRHGEHLAEGFAQVARVRIKKRLAKTTVLEIVLDEGRNREIRRLLARVGHPVRRLVRVAIGPLRLGTLPSGESRKLTRGEIETLRRSIGRPTRPRGRSPRKRHPAQSSNVRKTTAGSKHGKPVPRKRKQTAKNATDRRRGRAR